MSARTYADLDQIVTDLPAARADVVPPASKINGLAIASLACGLAQFVCGPLATIPAIVFGHVARHLACTWLGGGVQGHFAPRTADYSAIGYPVVAARIDPATFRDELGDAHAGAVP